MNKKNTISKHSWLKFFYDYLPIIVFFLCYKFLAQENRIVIATAAMLASAFFGIGLSYLLTKKIPKVALFSTLILGVFCGLSIYFESENYIKIKPTIVNLLFAAILYFGIKRKKNFLKLIMGEQIKLSEEDWLILSKRWVRFFLLLAVINEIVWRNFSTDFWVNFKVFGFTGLTLIFIISQTPLLLKGTK